MNGKVFAECNKIPEGRRWLVGDPFIEIEQYSIQRGIVKSQVTSCY